MSRARVCSYDAGCTHGPVGLYPSGLLCPAHAPPPSPTPDPDQTVTGMAGRPGRTTSDRYGTATTDPLGRTLDRDKAGKRFADKLPRHECPRCPGSRLPANHDGHHAT